MNYINIFQNAQDLSFSVGNTYSEVRRSTDSHISGSLSPRWKIFCSNGYRPGRVKDRIKIHWSEIFNIVHCILPSFMCDLLKILSYLLFQKKSCWHNVTEVLKYILFHFLGTQQLIFWYAHQYWHAIYSW